MRLKFTVNPKKVEWSIFWLLIISNLANPVYDIFLIFLVFIFRLALSPRLTIPKHAKFVMMCWLFIGIVMCFSFITHFSSLNNFFLGIFLFVPILIFPFLMPFYEERFYQNSDRLINALKIFTFVELLFMFIQFCQLVLIYKTIDIFKATNGGAGDLIGGTAYGFSSIISVSMGVISIIFLDSYLTNKSKINIVWFLISFIMMTLPGYTAGTLVYIISFIIYLISNFIINIFKRGIVNKRVGLLVLFFSISIGVFSFSQMSNIVYASNIVSSMLSINPPIKVKSIYQTIEYSKENKSDIMLGVGFGNYSSRAAFITGGEYLRNQPSFIPVTRSPYFEKYMLPIFNKKSVTQIIGGVEGSSMVNMPFNQVQTIFGEGGLFSLAIFLLVLFYVFGVKVHHRINLLHWGWLYLILLMGCDNWFSFPNFCLAFWLILLFLNSYSLSRVISNRNISFAIPVQNVKCS